MPPRLLLSLRHTCARSTALKQVGALTIQDSTFYQANLMQHAENLQSRIDEQVKNSLLSVLSDFQDGIPDTPPPLEEHTEPAQIHNVSNARTNNQCHTQDD